MTPGQGDQGYDLGILALLLCTSGEVKFVDTGVSALVFTKHGKKIALAPLEPSSIPTRG